MPNTTTRRSYARYTIVRSVLIFVILSILYWIVSQISLQLDVTRDKNYTLHAKSIDIVENLNSTLRIYYLEPKSKLSQPGIMQVHQLLKQIAKLNKKVLYEAFAVDERPLILSEFSINEQRIEPGSLLIQFDNKKRVIAPYQLLNYHISNRGAPVLVANNTEQLLISTILQFIYSKDHRILLPDNHGELSLKNIITTQKISLYQLLEQQGYQLVEGTLLTSNLENINSILLLAPSSDLTLEEYNILKNWLHDGKNIYLSINLQHTIPYQLERLLDLWDIEIKAQGVLEGNNNLRIAADSDQLSFFPTLNSHDINQLLIQENLKPIYRLPLRISPREFISKRIKHEVIAATTNQPLLISPSADGSLVFLSNDEFSSSAIPLALAVTLHDSEKNEGRLYLTSGDIAYLNRNYANELLFLQAVDWLHQQQTITIIPKNLYNAPMHKISVIQAKILGIFITFIIPSLLIIGGIAVFLQRKRG